MKHFNISFESDAIDTQADNESVTTKEKEYVLYFRLLNFKQLQEADCASKQLQWLVKIPKTDGNASSASIRVREETDSTGKIDYTLTIKSDVNDGKIESVLPCTKEVFTQFAFLAEKGMYKHRYCFPIENDLCWEIDVYPDGNGGYYPWGRAELEVKEALDTLPQLPIEVEEIIKPEEDDKVRELFEKYFLIDNKYKDITGDENEQHQGNTDSDISDSDESVPEGDITESSTGEENDQSTGDDNSSDDDSSDTDIEDTDSTDESEDTENKDDTE